jgi:hypothetical protein
VASGARRCGAGCQDADWSWRSTAGFAAVALALTCVKHCVIMVSWSRWDAALYHPSRPQPPGKRGPKPLKGKRQRRLRGRSADTPWELVEVDW